MRDYQVVWRGIVGDSTGYAQVSRHSVLALDDLGLDVRVEVFSNGNPIVPLEPSEQQRLLNLVKKPQSSGQTVSVIHLQPNAYGNPSDKERYTKRIGFTVWETDRLPEEWVPLCNDMDAIIVPSQFNKTVFRESGVTVPIYVARHGIDAAKFYPGEAKLDLGEELPSTVFLSVCSWQHRKGLDVLLESYYREFTNKDDVALVIKTGGLPNTQEARNVIKQYRERLGLRYVPAPIYVANDEFSTIDMNNLYHTASCFVLPSRGEGVGLPYLEAMATGLPCIAPSWGGQTDFLNKTNGLILNGELKHVNSKAANFTWFRDNMKWFEPDRRHLGTLMREVYRNPKEAQRKGKKAYETVIPTWTWENTIQDLVTIFDEVMEVR